MRWQSSLLIRRPSPGLEQGGASRAEAAPSVQRNGESISASGLYFSPFRRIQTAFQFYPAARLAAG